MSFHIFVFAVFYVQWLHTWLCWLLTDPQLPATASIVCATDAWLGGVGRVAPPPPNPCCAGVSHTVLWQTTRVICRIMFRLECILFITSVTCRLSPNQWIILLTMHIFKRHLKMAHTYVTTPGTLRLEYTPGTGLGTPGPQREWAESTRLLLARDIGFTNCVTCPTGRRQA